MTKQKEDAPELISLEEFHKSWPKDGSGKLCAKLLRSYVFSLLVETSIDSKCTSERAQAESATGKVLAKMSKNFSKLATGEAPAEVSPLKLKGLHRFSSDTPQPPTTKTEK